MNKPIFPTNNYYCDICGKLEYPKLKHKNWICLFFAWLDSKRK